MLSIASTTICCSREHEDAGLRAAQRRALESRRHDALFSDPYAACLVSSSAQLECSGARGHYELSTKFIDNKIMQLLASKPVNQVVLFTNGMDTRPYRLAWSSPTLVFDVSPASVFALSKRKLEDAGAKLPRSCLLRHVACESPCDDVSGRLAKRGYRGNKPSLWVVQEVELCAARLQCLFKEASGHVMKGSYFIGEVPESSLGEACEAVDSSTQVWKKFLGAGFEAEHIPHQDICEQLKVGLALGSKQQQRLVFIAKQLRLSHEQIKRAAEEIELAEETDEEGFQDLY